MRRRIGLHVAVMSIMLAVLGTHVSAAPQPGQVHFTVAGDFAQTGDTTKVLDTINGLDSDFTLAVGDLSYGLAGQEQAWCDYVTSHLGAGYPFELLAGNHESNGLNGNINDFSSCLPNQLPGAIGTYGRQYYVDVPTENPILRFIMISPSLTFPDGNYAYPAGSARYAWTAQAIDGARANAIPWVVVGMHKPCITVGRYVCDAGTDLFNLLVSKKVDLVLSGHEHSYQRSVQLAHGPDCATIQPGTFDVDCVTDSDAALTQGGGTVAMVVGTGGRTLYEVNDTDSEVGFFAAYAGANHNPSFGALDVTATDQLLRASFVPAPGSSFTDSFTISRNTNPDNVPPTAAFTPTCTDLTCAFDATGSADPDGSIVGYAWAFGDNTSATGMNANHAYTAANDYLVTLTVVDEQGATGQTTQTVTTTAPAVTTYAADDFARTVTGGWGSATTGGPWTSPGKASSLTVTGGTGNLTLGPGGKQAVYLTSVSSPESDVGLTVGLDRPATGGGVQFTAFPRRVSGQGGYGARVKFSSAGAVNLELIREAGSGADSSIQAQISTGVSYAVGERLNVRAQAIGTSPTTLRAKVWKEGTPEPANWLRSVTDTTAGLQAAGSVGVSSYISKSAASAPIALKIDDLTVVAP